MPFRHNATLNPVTVTCRHCACAEALLMPNTGDRETMRCPECGPYLISGTQVQLFDNGVADPKSTSLVNKPDGRIWLESESA